MAERKTYYAHGKLLISGEYVVLDGALALAVPTCYGQALQARVDPGADDIHWESYDDKGDRWFTGRFSLPGLQYLTGSDDAVGLRLSTILSEAARQGAGDLYQSWRVETRLDFPRQWGLGSSSTLLSLIAQWTGADPYRLLAASFGGSGYDLACATADGPLLYQLRDGRPQVAPCFFAPSFHEALYFVYLGQKQDSRAGIARHRERAAAAAGLVERISELTGALIGATDLDTFEAALREHEQRIASALDLPRVKEQRFAGFWGEVKSLGAWGGDFVLLTSRRSPGETRRYLRDRGFDVVILYREMVYQMPLG